MLPRVNKSIHIFIYYDYSKMNETPGNQGTCENFKKRRKFNPQKERAASGSQSQNYKQGMKGEVSGQLNTHHWHLKSSLGQKNGKLAKSQVNTKRTCGDHVVSNP